MAPRPEVPSSEESAPITVKKPRDGETVVISGMSGLYPKSRYVKDLEEILYNKINPVTSHDKRWSFNHPEAAQYTGNVPDINRFDANFFKVHYRLASSMDPMSRKLLEQSFEALYDAGLTPEHIKEKRIGVYVGTCFSEAEKAFFYCSANGRGLGIAGSSKSMFANRISYWLNAKGPSVSIDQDSCSSTAALEAAFRAISSGECDAAVVGGANLCIHPQSSVHYGRIMQVSKDGNTKSFADDADGCTKSESIIVMFLQKLKDAKRCYADVVHVKCEYLSIIDEKTGPKYGFDRNPSDVARFLKNFYEDAGVPPTVVEYVEAFGSAVPEADKSELEVIDEIFCGKRSKPLLVGSITSNIGNVEAASGLSGVTKVLLAYHNGLLAGNLHCSVPRRDVSALKDGRIQVLADHHPLPQAAYTAINNMSVTGVNSHVLLRGSNKSKDLNLYKSSIPRLVTLSGRHEIAVNRAFAILNSQPVDPEQIALLHNITEKDIAGHLGKGYIILDTNAEGKTCNLAQRVEYCDDAKRPLWFVYSGMGSQWIGMGEQLMSIPIFAAAIERCRKALEPTGIDIVEIISSSDKTIFDNILHSFVGIAAVQIGLTDILLALGLVPDKVIGHSVGELGCAYADGCLTAEEMILCAYSRGRVSLETPFIRGSMAAVGRGASEILSICPPEIQVACHNSAESCTISGPAEEMSCFVAKLTSQGIFAKEVPCSNIAYHSRYIADAGPSLLKYLKEVIKTPKQRSKRWLSTSVPESRWNDPIAKYCSAEYQINNLLNTVLFEETSAHIPPNAVVVEVAPHGLLQAILKRALPPTTTNIPLTRRGNKDGVLMLLEAIGKIYLCGYNPKVKELYPKVQFPVSTGTPFLSHLIDWNHEENWILPLYQTANRTVTANCSFVVSVHDEGRFLEGNFIGNKKLLPFSYVLTAVWDLLAMTLNLPKRGVSVYFEDVKLFAQPILHDQKVVRLNVSLLRGTGSFEVLDEQSMIASGYIHELDDKNNPRKLLSKPNGVQMASENQLCTEDVYKLFSQRGYNYSGNFRSIVDIDTSITNGKVCWDNNWVTFIDGLIQLNMLKYTHNGIVQPNKIRKFVIDVDEFLNASKISETVDVGKTHISVNLSNVMKKTSCGGVEIEGISFRPIQQANNNAITLHSLKFVPRLYDCDDLNVSTTLRVFLQIASENLNKDCITVLGLRVDNTDIPLFEEMNEVAESGIPRINIRFRVKSADTFICENVESYDIILIQNLSKHEKIQRRLQEILLSDTFVINKEAVSKNHKNQCAFKNNTTVSVLKNKHMQIELMIWKSTELASFRSTTVLCENDLINLKQMRNQITEKNGISILTSYPPVKGLISLVKSWRKELSSNNILVFMVSDKFWDKVHFNESIIGHNLAYNIYERDAWGGEYFLPLEGNLKVNNNMKLQSKVVGDFNTLHWVQAPQLPKSDTVSVAVSHTGINMGDVRNAMGLTSHLKDIHDGYGMEFSGITPSNERVMGLALNGTASKFIMTQPELIWPVPKFWSLEDAATVPFAYIYAYYCLFIKTTRVVDDEEYSVLVHGGTGALGQAAISIALARGWRVFATVRDAHKKKLFMKIFPKLSENNIGNSRDIGFKDMVLSATAGEGCNVVLCSLRGELKNASLSCCKFSGTVLDTAQIISNENYTYGMYNMTKSRSYLTVDIRSIFDNLNSKEMKSLRFMMAEGIASGEVRPLTRITFEQNETVRAFKLLAAGHHCGRVLLHVSDQPAHIISKPSSTETSLHMVICGPSPLGLQAVDKLIESGANKLHLHINGHAAEILEYKQRIWKQQDVKVTVTSGLVSSLNEIKDLFTIASQSGHVEGLYIIADESYMNNIIYTADLASRLLLKLLKHFVILTNNTHRGYNVCAERAQHGLPATLLDISLLKTYQDADNNVWYRGVAEAMNLAWQNANSVTLALPNENIASSSLVQKLASLTGLYISSNTPPSESLEQLGLSDGRISAVGTFLSDVYNTAVDERDIPCLTIQRLREIEERMYDVHFKEVKGLETFYSSVHPDELLASTEMVFMPTLSHRSAMRDDEFDLNGTYLIIVPGLEGLHNRFHKLCERLKLPAIVLQPGFDHLDDSLQEHELVKKYFKILSKKIVMKNKFYILGYETGVAVALKLAALLENQGFTGTVYALGDGPAETIEFLDSTLAEFPTEQDLQEAIVLHMYELMSHTTDTENLKALLRESTTWMERKAQCVRLLLGQVPHSAQYAHSIMEAAYVRLRAPRQSIPLTKPLRSTIVLMRSRFNREFKDSCSMKNYSKREIVVYDIDTPMAHIAEDLRISAIINSHLDKDILQAFESKNLCDSHLMNADAFITLRAS